MIDLVRPTSSHAVITDSGLLCGPSQESFLLLGCSHGQECIVAYEKQRPFSHSIYMNEEN